MQKTPDQIKADIIFGKKVNMVMEVLAEVFGPAEMNVVFQAIANWIGMLIFNMFGTPIARRDVVHKFFEQVELVITTYEQGKHS